MQRIQSLIRILGPYVIKWSTYANISLCFFLASARTSSKCRTKTSNFNHIICKALLLTMKDTDDECRTLTRSTVNTLNKWIYQTNSKRVNILQFDLVLNALYKYNTWSSNNFHDILFSILSNSRAGYFVHESALFQLRWKKKNIIFIQRKSIETDKFFQNQRNIKTRR